MLQSRQPESTQHMHTVACAFSGCSCCVWLCVFACTYVIVLVHTACCISACPHRANGLVEGHVVRPQSHFILCLQLHKTTMLRLRVSYRRWMMLVRVYSPSYRALVQLCCLRRL